MELLSARLHADLTQLATHGFAGVVLVAKEGRVVFARGYGFANRAARHPFTDQTIFDTGSITKTFTAAAILALEAEGRLRLTDTLEKYFVAVPPAKKGITLQQLLTHSAGFQGAIGDDFEDRVSRDAFVRLALDSTLLHPAGTRYAYSNVGYGLLGAIIELVSKMPYEQYVRSRLLVPAGMFETGYVLTRWDRARVNHTYSFPDGRDLGTPVTRPWAPDGPYWHLRANGGLLTTVHDLYRWHTALEGNELLPAQTRREMVTPRVKRPSSPSAYYGYGWMIETGSRGQRLVHHGGSDSVFWSGLNRYPDEGVVVIWTTNDLERTNIACAAMGESRFDRWLEQRIFD